MHDKYESITHRVEDSGLRDQVGASLRRDVYGSQSIEDWAGRRESRPSVILPDVMLVVIGAGCPSEGQKHVEPGDGKTAAPKHASRKKSSRKA